MSSVSFNSSNSIYYADKIQIGTVIIHILKVTLELDDDFGVTIVVELGEKRYCIYENIDHPTTAYTVTDLPSIDGYFADKDVGQSNWNVRKADQYNR